MTPELWARLNPLFDAAIETPRGERLAFIEEVCGNDSELRRELVALICAHEESNGAVGNIKEHVQALVGRVHPEFSPGEVVLGRFRIVRKLGSGGMGDVYEAFDLDLSQAIALKAIRPDIVENSGVLARFRREVQLARRLSGPNVCRIHELFVIGSSDAKDGAFLTMELLDGITLSDRIRQTGPIPWREAQALANDICSGVATIHEAGIIHRDLKSRNIMLVNRAGATRAVVMDFGLAHEAAPSNPEEVSGLTLAGAILGTPEYMAPEQFEGKQVTPAADLFALGIVLYEMLTGKHPFPSSNVLGAAVLRGRQPVRVSSIEHLVPHRVDLVIGKCLEYDVTRRYQSAGEVARALHPSKITIAYTWHWKAIPGLIVSAFAVAGLCAWLIPPVRERLEGLVLSSHEKHIAVLPFNVGDSNQEAYLLSDGLMDSLTGKLSSLDRGSNTLWVIPASEVRRRRVVDPVSAMREFGATLVVKGSFSRVNHTVRLNIELIDTRKMREVGFANVDGGEEDLVGLQDKAVIKLGRLMNISTANVDMHADDGAVNGAPYENYLAALGYLERYDRPAYLDGAIRSLTSAVTASPRFALALGALGHAYTLKYLIDKHPDSLSIARDFCTRALALDDLNPDLHATLAKLDQIEGRYELAEKEFRRVMSLDSRNVEAATGLAAVYLKQERPKDAEREYIKASELRPDDWQGYDALGRFYDRVGREKEAIPQFEHALRLTPDNAFVYSNLGAAYINSNDRAFFPAAETTLKRSILLNPSYAAYANLGNLYGLEHRFKESADATRKALDMDDEDYEVWENLAQAAEAVGDTEEALTARNHALNLAQAAINLDSRNAEAHSVLAALLAENHTRATAYSHIRTALMLAPKDQIVLSEVAEAYEALGERSLAIKYLQLALKYGFPKTQIEGMIALVRVAADPEFQKYRN